MPRRGELYASDAVWGVGDVRCPTHAAAAVTRVGASHVTVALDDSRVLTSNTSCPPDCPSTCPCKYAAKGANAMPRGPLEWQQVM